MRGGSTYSLPKIVAINNRLSNFRRSLWLALGIMGGWLISRFSRKRQKPFVAVNEKAERSHRGQVRLDWSKVSSIRRWTWNLDFGI